jgi:virulence factor
MPFRLGLAGLCTSHPQRWVPIIRELSAEHGLEIDIVAAWDSGEVRPPGFAARFCREMQIPLAVERLADMPDLVDGVIIHTANWDRHVEQARLFVDAGRAVLIDKPLVGHLRDARQLLDWAAAGKRITGGSSLRFAREIRDYLARPAAQRGRLHTAFGGCGTDEFFYGIHAYAMLLGLMGPGVRSVEYLGQPHQKLLKIEGTDGTVGLLVVGQAAKLPFYLTAVSTATVEHIQVDSAGIYRALLETCLPYLCGRAESPPLPMEVLLEPELAALAAQRSWLSGGEVLLTDLRQDDPGYDGTRFTAEYRQAQK